MSANEYQVFAMMMIIIWTNPPTSSPQHIISCRFDFCFIFKKSFHFFCLGITWSFSYISPAVLTTTLLIISSSIKKKNDTNWGGKEETKKCYYDFSSSLHSHSHTHENFYVKKKEVDILLLSWRSMSNFLQERFFGKGIFFCFSSYSPGGVVYKQMCNECFCFRGQERKKNI